MRAGAAAGCVPDSELLLLLLLAGLSSSSPRVLTALYTGPSGPLDELSLASALFAGGVVLLRGVWDT